jgi:hypothetical protein
MYRSYTTQVKVLFLSQQSKTYIYFLAIIFQAKYYAYIIQQNLYLNMRRVNRF